MSELTCGAISWRPSRNSPPSASTIFGNLLDTFLFFSIAFWHSDDPFMAANWVEIASVDYVIKLIISLVLFVPLYGMLLNAIVRLLPGQRTVTA